jgi:hypothetical protein
MLFTLLILLVLAIVLSIVLWAGALWLQGWLYESPGQGLHWRAPVVGAALALFYGLWVAVDCRTEGHCGSMYKVSVSTLKQYDELKAVVKKNGQPETYRRVNKAESRGDYLIVGPDGLPGTTRLTETPEKILIEEDGVLTVKLDGGDTKDFAVPAAARVTVGGKEAKIGDIKAGDAVAVAADASNRASAVEVVPAAAVESGPAAAPAGPAMAKGKVVKAQAGATFEFEPERDANGNFRRDPGQDLRYNDKNGRFIDEGNPGQVQQFRWDWLLWNVFFHIFHLGLWFAGLWLVLRFQWSHALGFAVCLWLAMTLIVIPMLLNYAELAFQVVK